MDGVAQGIIERWLRVGADGTGEACSTRDLPTGTYRVVAAKNTLRTDWVAVDATVIVNPAAYFTMTVNPGTNDVAPTGSVDYTVTVATSDGYDRNVTLSVENSTLPPDVEARFDPATLSSPYGSSTLTLTTDGASLGTSTVTVTGTGDDGLSRTATFDLVVTTISPDFTITASPVSQSVTPGEIADYEVRVKALNGFNDVVALNVTAPSLTGVRAEILPASIAVSGDHTSRLRVRALAGAMTGTTTVTVTGTGGGLVRDDMVTLTVDPAVPEDPDFAITAAPVSRTVTSGNGPVEVSYTVTVQDLNGFNSAVTLEASGWASSETSFSSTSLTSPYTASSTLTLNVPAGTPAGTTTVTVTGTSGTLSHAAPVRLTVATGPPLQREYIYLGGRVIAVESP